MDQEKFQKQIKEVFSDAPFVEGLSEMETAEEVQVALKEKGLEFSMEEVEYVREKLAEEAEHELSAEELDSVAGGTKSVIVGSIVGSVAGSVVSGVIGRR